MAKGNLENWSEKTKGIKIGGKWFNCTDFVLERAHQIGKGAEVEWQLNSEDKECVYAISGEVNHEKAVAKKPEGAKTFNEVQVRQSALKSACAFGNGAPGVSTKFILEMAKDFEKYLLLGSDGGN